MPQKNKTKYPPAAVDDRDEIFSYIAQDNVFAAETMPEKLNQSISGSANHPNFLPDHE